MSTPILATKLYIPPPRPNLVRRPRLIEQLNAGLHGKLTLISAPAGFGKTTLISEWIENLRSTIYDLRADSAEENAFVNRKSNIVHHVAWLSLDEGDSDPPRFVAYLVAALQTVAPTLGESVMGALQAPRPPAIDELMTTLINEMAAAPNHILLVLDDYHLLDAKAIDEGLAFLIEHLPPQLHLVITTREDPNLPLTRLRARGQMTEIRAADLRFTPDEAADFLNRTMGLTLAPTQVAALEARTEGWIAGIQLAALSMQGRDDLVGFIQAFAGDNRYIGDYLAEEVLQRQPERVRNFLLQTAMLDRLCGPLCDAVTGQNDGKTMLTMLERANLFVVPLDDQRQWYRYHHLFADLLYARALEAQPDQVRSGHQRASTWCEHNGLAEAAIRHALAAADFERAADLIELAWPTIHGSSFQHPTFHGWMQALPDEVIRARPVLSVGYAWELLDIGEFDGADVRLRDAEQWLAMQANPNAPIVPPAPTMAVVDTEYLQTLPATIAVARTYLAQSVGNLSATVEQGRRALELLPEENYLQRGQAAALLGLVYWAHGALEMAYDSLAAGMASLQKAGNIPFALSGVYGLGDIRIAQGRLHDAKRVYEQALRLAHSAQSTEPDDTVLQGTAELHLGLSELHLMQGDLAKALQKLGTSEDLGEKAALPTWPFRAALLRARIKQTQGDFAGALDALDEAERTYFRGPVPDVRPIAAWRARVWMAQSRLDEALSWVQERGLSVADELSYLNEFEYITLARVLIAQFRRHRAARTIQDAIHLLDRLRQAAEAGGRMGNVIEILLLQALAHQTQGDISDALRALDRALKLAEPERYVRIFVDEGEPMAQLLSNAAAGGIMPAYAAKLLSTLAPDAQQNEDAAWPPEARPAMPSAQLWVEPLSERELEVIHLIAQGLSNREIAAQLFIALNTVKGHNRVIFGKLQVQRRTEAVARARELGLIK
ncbi:MAG: LuxR C-terminal-related transcriptional regulator [Caldilineaceae bacterium]